MPSADATTPLWTCPRCGHRFVTRNMWHACSRHDLEEHFKGRPARVRELFNSWLDFAKQFGEVTVIPQKTCISFQVRVRFAGAIIRKNRVECGFWLKRQVKDARYQTMKKYVREAYQVGCQMK